MKTALDICDLWDALDLKRIWSTAAQVKKADERRQHAKGQRRANALAKLSALQGGAG